MNPPSGWQEPVLDVRASAGEVLAANLRAALDQICANAAGAAAGREPEYLHQVRVGLRRLRATLRAFRPLLRRREAAHVDRRLREMLHALGAARDWDVFRLSLRDRGLARAAQREGAGARRRARDLLRSKRFRSALRQVRAWAGAAPWRSGAGPGASTAAHARRALRRSEKSLRKAADGIDWSDAAKRHRVRIRVKRLRYIRECFSAARRERGARPDLKRLRKLQRILGELNDIAVQRPLLRQFAADARLRGPAATLHAALAARQRQLAGEAARAWERFAASAPYSSS